MPIALEFIARFCAKDGCSKTAKLSSQFLAALARYDWPGNVRELENAIERAVVFAQDKNTVDAEDLPPEVQGQAQPWAPEADEAAPLSLEELERQHILAVYRRFQGNRKATARALGIAENTLWRKLKRYNDGPAPGKK